MKKYLGPNAGDKSLRSKSLDDLVFTGVSGVKPAMDEGEDKGVWKELELLKTGAVSPAISCVLPHTAKDFVCSAVLAIGAVPLMAEDPLDLEKDLENCKAVVLDINAPKDIIEEFISAYDATEIQDHCPLVLCVGQAGTCQRKADLAERIISECGVSVITGKRGDIVSIAQIVLEKAGKRKKEKEESKDEDLLSVSAPSGKLANPARYRPHPPRSSPRAHARKALSPELPPRAASPRGVRKAMDGNKIHRVPTALPLIGMKGQFRESCMGEVCAVNSLEQAQLLAAHVNAFVHIYETNIVTSGEFVVVLRHNQYGMENLHSLLPCAGAVLAAVLSCVEDDVQLRHCTQALAVLYVAGEQGASLATQRGMVVPGSLRKSFIDALHYMDEDEIRRRADIDICSAGV